MARKDLASLIRQRGAQQPSPEDEAARVEAEPEEPTRAQAAPVSAPEFVPEGTSEDTPVGGGEVGRERREPAPYGGRGAELERREVDSYPYPRERYGERSSQRRTERSGVRGASDPLDRELAEEDLPKYQRLLRKEARLREDQTLELSRLARQLNRRKSRAGERTERITENTLIRVAVDFLLARESDLAGATEEELLDTAFRRRR